MKRIFTAFFTLACLLTLLAGCGSKQPAASAEPTEPAVQPTEPAQPIESVQPTDGPQEEQKTYTLEEISENSSTAVLLSRHSSVTCVRTFQDGNGDTTSTIRRQYTRENGFLRLIEETEDGMTAPLYYRQAYADETYAGAEYSQSADGQTWLTLYEDSDSYESYTNARLAALTDDGNETITETSMQDDAVVVTTRREYRDEADMYEISLYYLDPETDDLLYTESVTYSTADDSVIVSVKTEITYDAPSRFDVSPFETITGSSDYCEVNLIVDPQEDDMKVCWYPIAHGTAVMVAAEEGTRLFSDESLTQELDPAAIDISGAVCNIFVVRSK